MVMFTTGSSEDCMTFPGYGFGSSNTPNTRDAFISKLDAWLRGVSPQLAALWAKSGEEGEYLNLPQHLADVAATAGEVFDIWVADATKNDLSGELGIDVGELRRLVTWLAGLHDSGKASVNFQRLLEKKPGYDYLLNAVSDAGLPLDTGYREADLPAMPHSVASAAMLGEWLESETSVSSIMRRRLRSIVGAHHGIPADEKLRRDIEDALKDYPQAWRAVHKELLDGFAELTEIKPVLSKMSTPRAPELQLLTGIVVFADWIASNVDAFPLALQPMPQRLESGMAKTDITLPWKPTEPAEDVDEFFRRSFSWPEEFCARSVQRTMVEAARATEGPALYILEAETGVGKTEAALAAAHQLGAEDGVQGVYFAAPTMATANGLLDRTINWAQGTTGDTVASLYLAHSKNQLAEPYRALKYKGIAEDEAGGAAGKVVASQWMSGRRRGLLSNIVVGTVDQVLMLALVQRYSMLRHLALAGKVIIFDEVHSYDAYTSDYLKTTLSWLAYYGASVIVMTATLPTRQREELAEAYSGEPLRVESSAYPRITVVTEEKDEVWEPEPSPRNLDASLQVIGDELVELRALLDQLLAEGGCALVICNTIARAQQAYQELAEAYPDEVELHHAGFMAWERSQREDRLREELGPAARRGAGRPARKIVVATQVAEQSLDIDADVLITDLAPMDLVIQRIGRIHRHQRPTSDRPAALREPQVFIRGVVDRDGVPEIDKGAQAIYDPKILLATLLHLPERFRRPDDTAPLVEAVYGNIHAIPQEWAELWAEAERESRSREARAHARSATYRVPAASDAKEFESLFRGLNAAAQSLGDEERGAAQVRDSEPTVEVIPVMITDYGYRPLTPRSAEHSVEILSGVTPEFQQAWDLAMSTVRLPTRMTRWDEDFDAVVTQLEEETPPEWQEHFLLKGQLALRLDEKGEAEIGRFLVRYSSELGLEVMAKPRE
ncbi:CRISPR-associated helicase Cas3' [Corynebacterium urealyticum]|nr:CRISPR-associated helicase Cas3' [Corynebacterium urealyticum]